MPKKRKFGKIADRHVYLIAVLSSAILILLLLIIFKTPITNWLINFFITYEAAQVQNGESEKKETIFQKIFSPKETTPTGPISPIGPIRTAQTPLQGSFTELFSGVGWKNPINSNVYQDFKTLTISFPPDYEIEEVFNVGEVQLPIEVELQYIEVAGRKFKAEVKKIGEQYEGYLYEVVDGELVPVNVRKSDLPNIDAMSGGRTSPIFTSQYPGKIVLASDGSSKIFLLYAAYEGKAFEISVGDSTSKTIREEFESPKIERDYSSVFNARVTENGNIDPQVFYKDRTWWIFSKNETLKLMRISNGMASDLTEDVINFWRSNLPNIDAILGGSTSPLLTAAPAPEKNTIYLILGKSDPQSVDFNSRESRSSEILSVFRFRDLGFKESDKLIWESLRLNAWDGEVIRGRFIWIDDSQSGGVQSPKIKYFLSNDGGKNWTEADLNEFVQFPGKGGDFRWRAELYPSENRYESPWIKIIGVEYYIIRK